MENVIPTGEILGKEGGEVGIADAEVGGAGGRMVPEKWG